MSSILKFTAFLMTLAIFVCTGCSKDNPANPNGCATNFNWAVELEAEANLLGEAAAAYAMDPSTENCNDYKGAYQAYLDAAADIRLCVSAANQASYDAAIDDAQSSLDALNC